MRACVRVYVRVRIGPDNLWNYSAPIIARFAERITGSFLRRVYRQYLSPRADATTLRPYLLGRLYEVPEPVS